MIDGEFGAVVSLTVDDDGRIYVADYMSQDIKVFAPDGSALTPLGRQGNGPGEYDGIVSVVAGRGDTLFAFDASLQRITAYQPGEPRRLSYTLRLPPDATAGTSHDFLVPAAKAFLLQYSTPYNTREAESPHHITVRVLDGDGHLSGETLLQVEDRQALVTRLPGKGMTVGPLPYGREPFLRLGPDDRLYYGRNDSVTVKVYDLGGRLVTTLSEPSRVGAVTGGDLDRLIASYDTGTMGRAIAEDAVKNGRIPSTKPAYRALIVDDNGRIWLNIVRPGDLVVNDGGRLRYTSRAADANASLWWVLDPSGRRLGTVSLPFAVTLRVIRAGKVYGIETDNLGVERVVRYAVRD